MNKMCMKLGVEYMKPIVGVIPLWDDEKDSIWMLPGYMEGIREAGAIPIILPLTENENEIRQVTDLVQGVLFTGGHDVSPHIYGEEAINGSVICCDIRDKMEHIVLDISLEQNKSVLGICRGIQFINAALGGTLYQDLPSQYSSNVEHHQNPPYDIPVHEVYIQNNTPLYELIGKEKINVNSYHHQAVKTIAPSLVPMAISSDKLIEGLYRPDKKFFWAVQWHPEFSYKNDEMQRKIFEAFIESMRK